MIIHSNRLDINKFKNDFVTLYRGNDQEQVLDKIVELVNESDGSISSFLRKVDSIEEKIVQKYFRQAAVAQMYNAGLNYYRRKSCYVETSAYGEAIFIKLPSSTVVLSKYGDILFNEGEIWTHSGTNYGRGFVTRKIIDGQVSSKYGFIDNYGARVLPCIFDYIEAHLYENPYPKFGGIQFTLCIYGKIDSVDSSELDEILDAYGDKLYCISEDSILFTLESNSSLREDEDEYAYVIPANNTHQSCSYEESMTEIKSLLSPLLVSKERLQEIIESK